MKRIERTLRAGLATALLAMLLTFSGLALKNSNQVDGVATLAAQVSL